MTRSTFSRTSKSALRCAVLGLYWLLRQSSSMPSASAARCRLADTSLEKPYSVPWAQYPNRYSFCLNGRRQDRYRFSPTFSTIPHFSSVYRRRNAMVLGRLLRLATSRRGNASPGTRKAPSSCEECNTDLTRYGSRRPNSGFTGLPPPKDAVKYITPVIPSCRISFGSPSRRSFG